jgi:hypothetical protein
MWRKGNDLISVSVPLVLLVSFCGYILVWTLNNQNVLRGNRVSMGKNWFHGKIPTTNFIEIRPVLEENLISLKHYMFYSNFNMCIYVHYCIMSTFFVNMFLFHSGSIFSIKWSVQFGRRKMISISVPFIFYRFFFVYILVWTSNFKQKHLERLEGSRFLTPS